MITLGLSRKQDCNEDVALRYSKMLKTIEGIISKFFLRRAMNSAWLTLGSSEYRPACRTADIGLQQIA